MNLMVSLEHRYCRTPDGAVWTQTESPYTFWQRYLTEFQHVCVLARVRDVASVTSDWTRADGQGVSFCHTGG